MLTSRVRPRTTAATIPTTTQTGNTGKTSGEKEQNRFKVLCYQEKKQGFIKSLSECFRGFHGLFSVRIMSSWRLTDDVHMLTGEGGTGEARLPHTPPSRCSKAREIPGLRIYRNLLSNKADFVSKETPNAEPAFPASFPRKGRQTLSCFCKCGNSPSKDTEAVLTFFPTAHPFHPL